MNPRRLTARRLRPRGVIALIAAVVFATAGAPAAQEPLASVAARDDEAAASASTTPAPTPSDESFYYAVEHYQPPAGVVLEVGGMDWLSDGRLALSTRRGQVWFVENALADDIRDATFTLFAEGLHEGLGLHVMRGEGADGGDRLFVLQRGELTELSDSDADGRADTFRTVTSGWGLSGNYHEFAFGLPRLPDGRFAISLNVAFLSPDWWVGQSIVPYRGWVLAIDPESGAMEPIASGFRSPCGLGLGPDDELLVTDNQGDWMPVCGVFHATKDSFASHPASLDWTPEYRRHGLRASTSEPVDLARKPPALWLPYGWSRSTGNLIVDESGGAFGPFAGQLLIAEMTNGNLLRGQLETIDGVQQGASFLMRREIGSITRVLAGADGTLLCGLTNRGWGGLAPSDGLARVRWTGEAMLEVSEFRAVEDGFALRFTAPLSEASVAALQPSDLALTQYDYSWWWEYGSPEQNTTEVIVDELSWNAARDELRLTARALQPGFMVRLMLPELAGVDARPLVHRELSYTLHRMPGRAAPSEPIAKVAPVPPPRLTAEEGWLRLSYGDALAAWDQHGWELVDATWKAEAPGQFTITPGNGALVPTAPDASAYRARWDLGSGQYEVDVMLAADSRLVLEFDRGAQLVLSTERPARVARPPRADAGGPSFEPAPAGPVSVANGTLRDGLGGVHVPSPEARLIPGNWHRVQLTFARASPEHPAQIESVALDGLSLHTDVEVAAPGQSFTLTQAAGAVALRTLSFLPARPESPGDWVPLFNGDDFGAWAPTPAWEDPLETEWEMDSGTITSDGELRTLFSPRDDYVNVEIAARVRVNDRGTGALVLRADAAGNGYAVTLNTTAAGPEKMGSLRGLEPVSVELIPAGTWAELRASVRDEPGGARVRVWLNGVRVVDLLDAEGLYPSGRLALRHDHEDTRLRVADLRVRAARWPR